MPQGFDYWTTRPKNDPRGDWGDSGNWIQGYWQSQDHPHRQLIVKELYAIRDVGSILELGCNCGPNLAYIRDHFPIPELELAGIDANTDAIALATERLPSADFKIGNLLNLPWNKQFDVVIADAVLMYISPAEIAQAMKEIARVAKKAVIIIDRFDESVGGEIVGHVWGRNYERLLDRFGFKARKEKLADDDWPTSENWKKYGYLFVGTKE